MIPATVTISIQDRPAPQGPSIAVSITPDPSTTPKDAYSPAVALWVLIRAHIQQLQEKSRAKPPTKVKAPNRVAVKAPSRPQQGRKPHRAATKRAAR